MNRKSSSLTYTNSRIELSVLGHAADTTVVLALALRDSITLPAASWRQCIFNCTQKSSSVDVLFLKLIRVPPAPSSMQAAIAVSRLTMMPNLSTSLAT